LTPQCHFGLVPQFSTHLPLKHGALAKDPVARHINTKTAKKSGNFKSRRVHADRVDKCLDVDCGNSRAKFHDVEHRIKKWLDKFDAKVEALKDPSFETVVNAALTWIDIGWSMCGSINMVGRIKDSMESSRVPGSLLWIFGRLSVE